MVEKETISSISKFLIKLRIHTIHILADSIFDIITLREIGRKLIDTKLLMNKAISRLYTVLRDTGQRATVLISTVYRMGEALFTEGFTFIYILIHIHYFTPFIDKAMRLRFKSTSVTLTIKCSWSFTTSLGSLMQRFDICET